MKKLIAAGFIPTVSVEERSAVSEKRCKWYARQLSLAGAEVPTVDEMRITSNFKRVIVEDMNNDESKKALSDANLDVIFLGGAGIMQEDVFSLARFGSLNTHPGMLPYIRGSLPVAQSIVRDIPLGVSLHRVSPILDCGGWVQQAPIPISRQSTFEEIVLKSCEVAGDLFIFAINQILKEERVIEAEELPISAFGPNMKWSSTIEDEARSKLAAGTYLYL